MIAAPLISRSAIAQKKKLYFAKGYWSDFLHSLLGWYGCTRAEDFNESDLLVTNVNNSKIVDSSKLSSSRNFSIQDCSDCIMFPPVNK